MNLVRRIRLNPHLPASASLQVPSVEILARNTVTPPLIGKRIGFDSPLQSVIDKSQKPPEARGFHDFGSER